ncbi:MAG TPA: DUF433 domain-containing protein [Lacipirellulaceae bacterium]|nr:DUF433 domain-containing protein [Lacipirellulaceae bacterium]
MSSVINVNPNILGGTPVIAGAHVPIDSLFDYIKRGRSIEYFLTQFPTVRREQVDALLDEALAGAMVARESA